MQEAVIIDCLRTAVGKSGRGTLRNTRPDDLGATVVNALLTKYNQISKSEIDDVIFGCAMPEAESGMNMARVIALRAGLLIVAVVLTACRSTPADATLPPVTLPPLSDMEASVQQQITGQFETVTRLARDGAAADALAPAYGTLGSMLFAVNRANAAEIAYLHAQALAPADVRWPYYLGHVYLNRPDRPKAIAAFERALDALDQQDALDDSIAASLADEAAGRVHPVDGIADVIRAEARQRRGH